MELSTYLRILRRSWPMVLAFTVLGLVGALAFTLSLRPTYTAQTKLFVATQSSGTVGDLQQGNTFIQARVQSYVETATTPAVLEPAAQSLGKPVGELMGKVTASAGANTVIISIVATDDSSVQAAVIAQAVGKSLIDVIDKLEKPTNGTGSSPVRLSVVTPATPPNEPSSPNIRLNTALGGAIGLVLGAGLSLLRHVLNTKVRGEADLQRVTDAPVLGGIAFDGDATKKPLLTQAPSQGTRAESFRQIRTNLQFAHVSHGSKAVLVTSSLPGEGKSTTAINLAIAIGQAGQSVALVDADLRRSRVGDYLGLEKNAGLTTALLGHADVNELLQHWGQDELYVLTAGQTPHNPSELLGTEAMKNLILRLEQDFDAVIIDAPPLLPVTDAAVLAQHVGGVVLLVGSSRVKLPDLEKSLNALDMVEADVMGVVLNFLPAKGPDAYAYSYYNYETSPPPKAKRGRKNPRDRRKRGSADVEPVQPPPHDHAAPRA